MTSIVLKLFLDHVADTLRDRTNKAVGQQHAEEGPNKSATQHRAEDRKGLIDGRHRLDDTQHRRNDSEGRQRIGCSGKDVRRAQHGFRATFKGWSLAASYPDPLSELALAHSDKDKERAAYAREDMLKQRRPMMDAWGEHCAKAPSAAASFAAARPRREDAISQNMPRPIGPIAPGRFPGTRQAVPGEQGGRKG